MRMCLCYCSCVYTACVGICCVYGGMCVLCMWVCVWGYVCGHPANPFKETGQTIVCTYQGQRSGVERWEEEEEEEGVAQAAC